ncbi:egg cell-secreted protein 1.2-like [Dendrobium catenatum]|uniref:Egg cell-secreted protein 1.2 n=1 Tax=Dendrobium catenatum TaxID=906689 RepID=A0A2I0WRS5_9ASPA|nr:egg cell-secreted protein 1.2-like [Dendrobium catenatum]PKU78372.1 Egg cell-secreted protein 1.2 [Dendrobium catenatum]
MAKSVAAAAYAILFLVTVGTTMPTASSFQLIPDIIKCWKAVVEVEHCAVKLIPSFLTLHIRLTQDCCKAFVHIEESCLPIVFTAPLLGPGLSNITSTICGILADPPSPPTVA